MIAFYDNQPTKLEAVGNGSYVYPSTFRKLKNPPPLNQANSLLMMKPRFRNNGNVKKLPCGLRFLQTR